jgi:hypothetical protein
MFEGI